MIDNKKLMSLRKEEEDLKRSSYKVCFFGGHIGDNFKKFKRACRKNSVTVAKYVNDVEFSYDPFYLGCVDIYFKNKEAAITVCDLFDIDLCYP